MVRCLSALMAVMMGVNGELLKSEPVPKEEWSALCEAVFESNGFCWSHVRKAFSERFPGVPVNWSGCADRSAAQRWAWAAIMEKNGNGSYADTLRRVCEQR